MGKRIKHETVRVTVTFQVDIPGEFVNSGQESEWLCDSLEPGDEINGVRVYGLEIDDYDHVRYEFDDSPATA